MSTFDKRENAFENKFALDADQAFKAAARRDKLTGLWAAGLLGHTGDAAAAYAKSVVLADMEEAGDEDVIRKLVADLQGKATREEIVAKLHSFEAEAAAQIKAGV
jgi:hypothetical protein